MTRALKHRLNYGHHNTKAKQEAIEDFVKLAVISQLSKQILFQEIKSSCSR